MSTVQATNLKHGSSASNNIVLDASGNAAFAGGVTVAGNATITGNTTITGTLQAGGSTLYPLVRGTEQATTSGTSIDFTGIPSWVRRITVMFNSVSTNGTSNLLIQVGSGSFVTSGYNSTASSANLAAASTAGLLATFQVSAATGQSGLAVLANISGNTWAFNAVLAFSNATSGNHAGGVTPALSGALDRVRITTVAGTDTFDAGSINLLWE